jgi:hypothetical protein
MCSDLLLGIHGDCEPSKVADWGGQQSDSGMQNANAYCDASYVKVGFIPVCKEITTPYLEDANSGSIYCNYDQDVAEGGCQHRLFCCMCAVRKPKS